MRKMIGLLVLVLFADGLFLGPTGCSTDYGKRDKSSDSSNRDGSGY